ncbi:MAG TPA: TolC family protein [Bryobacteraceae bacterium]|nr:TolC family protein [Bryobacteraceae bacterium]
MILLAAQVRAQDALSVRDAVRLAVEQNKSIQATVAGSKAAEAQIAAARGGYLPKLNYTESFTRSNNPVFVFSSLLTQHLFTEQNFQVGPLNRPDFLNNFQSQVTVDQVLYDAGQTKHAVRAAELRHDLSGEEDRRTRMEVIAGVVRAYYGAVLSAESLQTAREAVRSAEADLQRASTVRSAGMSTDVDVLSIRVHLAGVKEQEIRRAADLDVARAALNEVLGLPLDAPHKLSTPLQPARMPDTALADLERQAAENRPEARAVELAARLARTEQQAARGSLLPEVGFHGAFEADRQRFVDRGGANWLASFSLRWNLFNGQSDKARIQAAGFSVRRAEAEQERAGSGIRLEVRRAWADLRAAQERIEVARASVAEAQESLRITQNRYAAGLSTVTDLLRTETALLESKTRYLAAVHDQRIAATMLELAAGTLSPDSEVIDR